MTEMNGFRTPPQSPSTSMGGSVRRSTYMTSSTMSATNGWSGGHHQSSVVRDTATALKRKSASQLGAGVSNAADKVSFLDLVQWIRTERLQSLPHKGSKWDSVLIRALYFAERLHEFEDTLKPHALDTEEAGLVGYKHMKILLELGHENSVALDKAFNFMYRCSLAVTAVLARAEIMSLSADIYSQLCLMYTDLLSLVVDVAVRFYKAVHGSDEAAVAGMDMFEVFGDTIETFRQRRDDVTKAIWNYRSNGEDIDVSALNRWLAPQDDVLAKTILDHTLIAETMGEYTCVWFHGQLAQFIKSEDSTLLVNGGPGSGKTVLAAAVAERLQRPVARQSLTTVFFSVGAAPSQVSSLTVVQALLHQLLTARVGNMNLYHSVSRAYGDACRASDPKDYENVLWKALAEALKTPLDNANETVVIVDGLDQISEGKAAGSGLLQRLVSSVEGGKATKLIAFAEDLKLPSGSSGSLRTIAPTDTSGDIHEISLKKLASSHHFRSKSGREQESIISRVVTAANGSFTWAVLTCDALLLEKSADDFTKAVANFQSPQLSTNDLVLLLVTRLQPTDDAKLLLAWLSYATRPLTYEEIECVYSVNASSPSGGRRPINVQQIVSSLSPLLSARDNTVTLRHSVTRQGVRDLFKSSKINVPVKDPSTDFFLRILSYAKLALPDKGEPTLEVTDRDSVMSSFGKSPLLEYTTRYWVWHLTQTVNIKPGSKAPDVKQVPELGKCFPTSTTMAILEWIWWQDQFPGSKEVEVHQTAGDVRKQVLTEQHPATLQSHISTACYFDTMKNWDSAGPIWYIISTVGRDILSISHPIVVESGTRFLYCTEHRITSSRTDVTTQRETILTLLISAYERQFGKQSEIVVQTRQRLAQLYRHISEHERADAVLKVVQGGTGYHERHDSGTTRDTNGQMHVSLGRARRSSAINGYDNGIFIDDDEDEEDNSLTDVAQIDVSLQEIDRLVKKKDHAQAEQLYVDLLQRISQACRSTSNVEWHSKKIEAFQSYSAFLESQERRQEAVSLTTSLWRDYQHSELSFSETVVSRLRRSARFLKSVGEYSAALSIYKHASSFYQNVRKDESRSFTEIEEEMAAVSSQALSKTSRSTSSKTESQSTDIEMFNLLIMDRSKSIDASTMSLAKSLTTKYMQQRSWSQAISTIEATLSRTWSSFFSESMHNMTLATSFQSETLELIEQLASIYTQQRRFDKVEDIYARLFRAALSSPKDQAPLLEKTKQLLIEFYTTRGYPDKAIAVYQELLAVYRRVYGPDHEKTVAVLYELGSRCRAHARSHPYWIEYYQQIVSSLNKGSSTVHTRAMDAAIIVAKSYWEEHRSSDAVAIYGMVWNTFLSSQNKEFKIFKDEIFVRGLFDQYYQSLEETKADFSTLRKVTAEYRDNTKAMFGAESSIAVDATLALAKVSEQSESHLEESISLYEEASSRSAKSSSSSSTAMTEQSDLRQALTTMYRKRIFHSTSSSASSETISKATSLYQEQLKEMKSKQSYSSEETLSSLRELSSLYVRQGKTESASQELSKAVVEIVQHETSSQRMYEAAESIVSCYQSLNMKQRCVSLVEELHYQLIVKEKRSSSSFSLQESKGASLAFVAAMQYQLRKDLSVTLTEITASLTAESIMYNNFKRQVTSNASLDKVLIAAAPLRHLCHSWKHEAIAEAVEHECVQLFVRRDVSNIQLLSKDSPRLFIVGLLDYLGAGGRRTNDFVRSVILAGNRTTKMLVDKSKFADAHDVVKITFMYAQYQDGYRTGGAKGISRGFELASYLDGRGENKCADPQLRKKLLQLSNDILKDLLKICKEQDINIAQVSLTELNELIALLGEQQDYDTLETLLNQLWSTREAQTTWPAEVLTALGRHLICARHLAGHPIKALRLCEDVAYNFRRVRGVAHPATLQTYELLAQLYTSTAQSYQREGDKGLAAEHFRKAVAVHEDILRWVTSEATGGELGADDGDDDDDGDTAAAILADHGVQVNGSANGAQAPNLDDKTRSELVTKHLRLLKLAIQRLGTWPQAYGRYESLNAQLFRVFPEALKGYEGVEKWQLKAFGAGKAESDAGMFDAGRLGTWELIAA